MSSLLRITESGAVKLHQTSMSEARLREVGDLEQWLIESPEMIDPGLKIVASQFSRWQSESASASERPDLLALSDSGELVVIELKRGSDRLIHLQALTYAAMSSSFTRVDLARAHAKWLSNSGGEPVSIEDSLSQLSAHVDGEWTDELLTVPRIILVAEDFSGQVITTVQWMATVAPNVGIECHEYHVFDDGEGDKYVSFQRLYPVDDLSDRTLKPSIAAAESVSHAISENKRGAKSVSIIHDEGLIPVDSRIDLSLESMVSPEIAKVVENWLDEDSSRRDVRWRTHRSRPLVWAEHDDPNLGWSPTKLRDEIFRRAGAPQRGFFAGDSWKFEGKSLYEIANSYR